MPNIHVKGHVAKNTIVCTQGHTHTQLTALPGPLVVKWSVKLNVKTCMYFNSVCMWTVHAHMCD